MTYSASIGYMILAMKKVGYIDFQIDRIINALNQQFDVSSTEKAENIYRQFASSDDNFDDEF